MLRENILQALSAIRQNLLRASLTMFIIALGIGSLVGVLTMIDSIQGAVVKSFSSLGANTFNIQNRESGIRIGGQNATRKRYPAISLREAKEFQERFKNEALVTISGIGENGGKARYKGTETNPTIQVKGEYGDFLTSEGYTLAEGRSLSQEDEDGRKDVCVIGDEVRLKLFPNQTPIGKTIFVEHRVYEVVGLFKSKGSTLGPGGDRVIVIPLSTLLVDYSQDNRSFTINVYTERAEELKPLVAEAEGIFRLVRKIRPKDENNFSIGLSDAFVKTFQDITVYLRQGATAIAIITLFGASIGLMNIMLVSVTERTREIGVRKAVGASAKTILSQFLIEAITICQLGGVVGIVLGLLFGNLIGAFFGSSFIIPWLWMLLGIVICLVVGVAAGIYPASRAAALDPIESLRYE